MGMSLADGASSLLKAGVLSNPLTAAPLAVVSSITSAIGLGGIFKSPSPRIYGRLYSTITELQNGIEGRGAHLNNTVYDDVGTVRLIDRERRSDSGMQGIWTDLVPTWSPTPAARALIAASGGTAKAPVPVGAAGTLSPMGKDKAPQIVAGVTTSEMPGGASWLPIALVAAAAAFLFLRRN